jgi:hypothetical protein
MMGCYTAFTSWIKQVGSSSDNSDCILEGYGLNISQGTDYPEGFAILFGSSKKMLGYDSSFHLPSNSLLAPSMQSWYVNMSY